jgi:hypothetical protein
MRSFSSLTTLWLVLAAQPTAVRAQAAAAAATKPVPREALSDTMLDRTVAWVQSFFKAEHGSNAIGHFAAARGLSFAFPTQTLHVEDEVARKLAGVKPAVLS